MRKSEDPHPRFFSVGDVLALRNVAGTITRKRSQDIVNKWRQAEIWAKAKAKALNFRQGPARATTRTAERRGVVREGGRRAQRIISACVRRTCGIALRRKVGGGCSTRLQDRSAEARLYFYAPLSRIRDSSSFLCRLNKKNVQVQHANLAQLLRPRRAFT